MVDQYDVALELGAGNGLLAKILPKARAKINTLIQTDISGIPYNNKFFSSLIELIHL
jgi:hypothetical protein